MRSRFLMWVVLALTVSMTGCCNWCRRHCCQPAAQPVAYAPPPVAYAPAPQACCAPAAPPPVCCQPAPVYQQAPVCCPSNYQPQPTNWARPMVPAQPGGVCCQ